MGWNEWLRILSGPRTILWFVATGAAFVLLEITFGSMLLYTGWSGLPIPWLYHSCDPPVDGEHLVSVRHDYNRLAINVAIYYGIAVLISRRRLRRERGKDRPMRKR